MKEVTEYYTYYWVADELLLDDFPAGREWEVHELALFSLNTDRLRPTTPVSTPGGDDAICAINMLKTYVEAVDDFERDDLYQAITNLTMQWLAWQTLQLSEPLEHRVINRHGSMRPRSSSMNGQSTREIPKFEPLTFSAVQKTLSATLRNLDHLEWDSVPRFADHIENTSSLGSSLTSKNQPGSPSTTANAPEKLVSDNNSGTLHVGLAAASSQILNAQVSQSSPVFVSAQLEPCDRDPTSQASHFSFNSDIDRSRRLLDPTKIAQEVLGLLRTPIVLDQKDAMNSKGYVLISQLPFLLGQIRIQCWTKNPTSNLPWACQILKTNELHATSI